MQQNSWHFSSSDKKLRLIELQSQHLCTFLDFIHFDFLGLNNSCTKRLALGFSFFFLGVVKQFHKLLPNCGVLH